MKHFFILFGLLPVAAQQPDPPPRIPTIDKVLSCGRTAIAGSLADGTDLQRFTFSPGEFPNALCNDGSPAIFYYRPFKAQKTATAG